jgi:hypothetical protein
MTVESQHMPIKMFMILFQLACQVYESMAAGDSTAYQGLRFNQRPDRTRYLQDDGNEECIEPLFQLPLTNLSCDSISGIARKCARESTSRHRFFWSAFGSSVCTGPVGASITIVLASRWKRPPLSPWFADTAFLQDICFSKEYSARSRRRDIGSALFGGIAGMFLMLLALVSVTSGDGR